MIFTDEEREEILQAFDRWADDNHLTLAARRKAVDAWLAAYDLGVSRVYSKAARRDAGAVRARHAGTSRRENDERIG